MLKSSVLKFLFIAGVSAKMQPKWPKAINPTYLNFKKTFLCSFFTNEMAITYQYLLLISLKTPASPASL